MTIGMVIALSYGLLAAFWTYFFSKVITEYYKIKLSMEESLVSAFVGLFWPLGAPIFIWVHRLTLRSWRNGRDWADDHISDPKARSDYRELCRAMARRG